MPGTNRAWSSAKVSHVAACEHSAHESADGLHEATRRSEAHMRGTTVEATPFSGGSGGGFSVQSGQVGEGSRGVGRHGRPSFRGDAGELKRAKSAAQLQPASVRLEQCRSFIERAKKRISDLEAEKAIQQAELREAEMRLVRLEAEVAAPLPVPASTVLDLDAEVVSLRAQLQRTEEERDAALARAPVKRKAVCRGQGRRGHHMPPMPGLIPGDLTRWMEDRHVDLQNALSCDDHKAILEITSKLAEGASKLSEITGGMVP